MPGSVTYFVDAAVLVPLMVGLVRLAGLRAFSKMSSYDFAVTVAFGSVLAGTVLNPDVRLAQGAAALVALFAVQWTIGLLRSRLRPVEAAADNTPVMLMRDGVVREAALAATRVTHQDLRAKLREAGVADPSTVAAVVLETTGAVSVITGGPLDESLLTGVAEVRDGLPVR